MNSLYILRIVFILFFFTLNLNSSELKKVTLQLAWFDQFQYAGYYIAKEKGYYEELGLDVEIIPFSYDKNIINDVNEGKIDFAIGRENLILEKQKYPNIVALAAMFQASPLVLISKKDSKIEKIEDFVNKKVMITKDDSEEASLKAMLASKRVDIKSLKLIPHSHNVKDLIDNKVDVISAYISKAPFTLINAGVEYNIFSPKDYGFDMYSDFLFTSTKLIQEDKNLAILFKNASLKGWEYAYSNIDEASEIILNKYNSQNLTKEELIFEANELKKLSYYNTTKLGEIRFDNLKRIYDLYSLLGLVNKNINLKEFIFDYENELVLSSDEKKYLSKKKILNVCVIDNLMPFSNFNDETVLGFVSDYMALLQNLIKTSIKFTKVTSLDETFSYVKDKKCDIIPMIIDTKERQKEFSFSKSYINLPLVMTTKIGEIFIDDLKNLKNKKISIVQNYAFLDDLRKTYKNIEFVTVKSLDEGLEKVLEGEIFAHIDFMQSSWYQIQTKYIGKLQISAKFNQNEEISIATLKDEKILIDIFDKSIKFLNKANIQDIMNKWVNKEVENRFDYIFIAKIFVVILIIVFLLIYRQYLINRANKRLKKLVDLKTKKLQNRNKKLSIRINKILEKNQDRDRFEAQQQIHKES